LKIEHELIHSIISNYYLGIIPNFYIDAFECDLFTLNKNLYTTEYEIKCSKSDFNNDFKKSNTKWKNRNAMHSNKHETIKRGGRTNRFYFVIESGIDVDIPDYAGLIEYEKHKDRVRFRTKKRAPMLHKNKSNNELIVRCLDTLTWRYYATTRNFNGEAGCNMYG